MVKENGMVMLTATELERMEREHLDRIEELTKRIEIMQSAIYQLLKDETPLDGTRVARADFVAIYNKALQEMFDSFEKECEEGTELPNDIYGYDITVHWHGIYCNCGDGATPSNIIIPAIEECDNEDPTEY